jgi:hypothetical protein
LGTEPLFYKEARVVIHIEQPPVTKSVAGISDSVHSLYIQIAADDISSLRKVDVYRVIESVRSDNIDGVTRRTLAHWIQAQRKDLSLEVDVVLAELNS